MDVTEKAIFEQFKFWKVAPHPAIHAHSSVDYIVVGCGSSYNLAMSVAATFNERGFSAIAAPGNEWVRHPRSYKAYTKRCQVIAISRSGETSELVQAARKSRSDGLQVIAITCDDSSSLAVNADHVLAAKTHPEEGIVMTASASLMLMLALRLAGIDTEGSAAAAEALLRELDGHGGSFLAQRTHFVYLGGGTLERFAKVGIL